MPHTVFLVGMAGSGKSALTGAYLEWLRNRDQDALVLNLDPGATALPYNPDIDARNYVNVQQIMLDYGLGPNGALIMASDLLADHVEEIRHQVDLANPDIVLADTPGQIELFAFREGGRFIANELTKDNCAVMYLMDSHFNRAPLNFISSLYLAAAIYSRVMQPQLYVLSKADLVPDSDIDDIVNWTTDPDTFEQVLLSIKDTNISLITRGLANAIFASGLVSEPIAVSAKNNSGLVELDAAVTRILTGGEEQTDDRA
jgi:hypothetical protein